MHLSPASLGPQSTHAVIVSGLEWRQGNVCLSCNRPGTRDTRCGGHHRGRTDARRYRGQGDPAGAARPRVCPSTASLATGYRDSGVRGATPPFPPFFRPVFPQPTRVTSKLPVTVMLLLASEYRSSALIRPSSTRVHLRVACKQVSLGYRHRCSVQVESTVTQRGLVLARIPLPHPRYLHLALQVRSHWLAQCPAVPA